MDVIAPKTVLIIDEEREALRFREYLEDRGFLSITAPNGREALAIVRGNPMIDLVITEMQLADMTGTSLLAGLRAAAPDLPLIVLTGSGSIENYLHAVTLGVYEYLVKPVSPGGLLHIADKALAEARPTSSARPT